MTELSLSPCRDPWKAWQEDMTELINLRLSRYAATSFWRSSTATHFGGINGTMTFDKEDCQKLADAGKCPPSPLNESWCARAFLHPALPCPCIGSLCASHPTKHDLCED